MSFNIYRNTNYYAPPHPFILQDTSGRNIFLKYFVCKAVCWPTMCRRCAALCGQSGWALRIRQLNSMLTTVQDGCFASGWKTAIVAFSRRLGYLGYLGRRLQSRFWKTILV